MDIGEGHHRVRPHGDSISATGSELWEEAQEVGVVVESGTKLFSGPSYASEVVTNTSNLTEAWNNLKPACSD